MNDLYLISNVMGWTLVVVTYLTFLPLVDKPLLWGDISETMQKWFWVSIVLSLLSFVIAMISSYQSGNKLTLVFWLGVCLYFIGASLWAPMLWLNVRGMVFLSLILTTVGALMMAMNAPEMVGTICFMIVFVHALAMDNVIWYRSYWEASTK